MNFLSLLTLCYSLELGGIPADNLAINDKIGLGRSNVVYTRLQTELRYKWAYVGGESEITAYPSFRQFEPTRAIFDFKAGIRFTDRIEVGFIHSCTHDVLTHGDKTQRVGINKLQSGYEKIFIKVSGSSVIFR